ncbi:LANO_0F08064g1_1 [Lachancea nothofagi CBS 11611]|uniref:LANO_0F08064g1_1 n=1 Tax=Lachancea nothofagi CBS 11611 TaxID=1266666 RepID=A0A1G4K990_9SACH|nr:LANO_0F08064g1_1 [Lachancea nothofagi CBS 11611]
MFNSGRPGSASIGNGVGGGSLFGQNKPATGGLFCQGNQQGQSNGLFGQSNPQNQTNGGAFNQVNQQGSGGGLFGQSTPGNSTFGQNTQGNTTFGQNTQGTNTFGQTTQGNNTLGQNTQGNNAGGLFGQSSGSGGLFGTSNAGARSGSVPAASGPFGQSAQNSANQNSSGSLFGQTTNTNTNTGSSGGLFGSKPTGLGTSNTAPSGGLFGNNATGGQFGNKPSGTGLFGSGNNNPAPSAAGGLFGNTSSASSGGLFGNKPASSSLFGNSGANNAMQSQMQLQPALQTLAQLPVNPMTRIADLPPQIRQEIEQLDQYVQRQVAISQHLKADNADHAELIRSVPRDIKYLQTTYSLTHQSLAQDLRKITGIKDITDQNMLDSQTFSTILQQLITPGSKISSLELDKFFQDKIQLYKSKLDEYFYVLSDIESAVRGIERDMFGATSTDGGSDSNGDSVGWKTGINAIVSTVLEEFELFMDMAERVAGLHQQVKEITGGQKATVMKA